jgi:methylaspartate ammonia-lyase
LLKEKKTFVAINSNSIFGIIFAMQEEGAGRRAALFRTRNTNNKNNSRQ